MATISRANLYRVPKRQWNKWTPQAREVFNTLFSTMDRNQALFLHPLAVKQSKKLWRTTAWNAAWMAADAAHGTIESITVKRDASAYEVRYKKGSCVVTDR